MKRIFTALVCLLVVTMPVMAGDHGDYGRHNRGYDRGHYQHGMGYPVGRYDRGVSWGTAGAFLAGLLLVDAIVDHPVCEQVVYEEPAPVCQRVVYVQPPQQQVMYVQPPSPPPAVYVQPTQPALIQQTVEQPKPSELQPGVDLIKIPITLKSGISVDVRILRVNGTFVGPKGEVYPESPTSKMLTEKYGS